MPLGAAATVIEYLTAIHNSSVTTCFYIADMPRPTKSIQRVSYADDISMWSSGVSIPDLEVKISNYLIEMSTFFWDNTLLILAPKSTVMLFTPDLAQAKTHPKITMDGAVLPLNRSMKILGAHLDTSLWFNIHCEQVTDRVKKQNIILKALAGSTWGQQKETLLKAIGRLIVNYAAPV